MRITDLDELIQPEIQKGEGFTKTHTDELGLIWTAHSRGEFDLTIDIQSPHMGQIAYITLEVNPDEETMSSQDTWVHQKFRRMGLATKMYNWAEKLGNTVVASSTLSKMGKKFWKHRTTVNELDFMGRACTKDCSGHKAGYKWSLDRGGITTQTHSPSFDDGTDLAQSKLKQRKQGGGKIPQYTSQTPNAIRKREARAQAKLAQQQTTVPTDLAEAAQDNLIQSKVAFYNFNQLLLNNLRAKYPDAAFEIDGDRVISWGYELIVIAEPYAERHGKHMYVGIEVIDVHTGPYKGVFARTLKQATEALQRMVPRSKPALWVENDMSGGTWTHIANSLGYRLFHV